MGRFKTLAKRIAFSALAAPRLLERRLRQSARDGRVTILNFHRVAPFDRSAYPPLDPQLFDDVIGFCCKHFDLLTFAELSAEPAGPRPRAVISFDDGYRDFVDHALPTLRRHGVRANQNYIVSSLCSGFPPPNVLLQDFIGKASDKELKTLASVLNMPIGSCGDRVTYGLQVSNAIKRMPIKMQKDAIARARQTVDLDQHATPMMSITDAAAAVFEVEVGAHSVEHANLLIEDDAYVAEDARQCRDFFANQLGIRTSIYALPNGLGGRRVCDILESCGFRTILLTGEQYATAGRRELPRFSIEGLSRAELRVRAVGLRRQ